MCVLILKSDVSPERLREFGFRPGREMFGKERVFGDGIGYEYMAGWYHKFLTFDEETGEYGEGFETVAYTDDDFDIPMVHMMFRIGNGDDLYLDCSPYGTYHIGGTEMNIVADTVFQLTTAGIVKCV